MRLFGFVDLFVDPVILIYVPCSYLFSGAYKKHCDSVSHRVPLVINTHGWIKGVQIYRHISLWDC